MTMQEHTAEASASLGEGDVVEQAATLGRHRLHRSPARTHAMKVLYGEDEWRVVSRAAEFAGLRPSSFVANAALAAAEQVVSHRPVAETGVTTEAAGAAPASATAQRELLAELIQARLAVRRYGVNVNQAAAVLNSGGEAPRWLGQAVDGAARAVERIDTASSLLARRLLSQHE